MIEINKLTKIEDFKKLPEIQKKAWGFEDLDLEPHHLMTRVQKYGGLVQGLFVDGRLIGFTYAIIGKWEGEYFIYSHQAAVIEDYQGQGYGFLLKKAQREGVLEMGYDVIRWNFDPLEAMNAYFNIHKLGVISSEYERDIYGVGESGLHRGLSTDRLIALWHLTSDRVAKKMNEQASPILEEVPEEKLNALTFDVAYIEIPRDIRTIKMRSMEEAVALRMKTRELFESAFQKGYVAEGMVFSMDKKRIFYRLVKQ